MTLPLRTCAETSPLLSSACLRRLSHGPSPTAVGETATEGKVARYEGRVILVSRNLPSDARVERILTTLVHEVGPDVELGITTFYIGTAQGIATVVEKAG